MLSRHGLALLRGAGIGLMPEKIYCNFVVVTTILCMIVPMCDMPHCMSCCLDRWWFGLTLLTMLMFPSSNVGKKERIEE